MTSLPTKFLMHPDGTTLLREVGKNEGFYRQDDKANIEIVLFL